jgi:glycosyltransferase involved in cell wall biosynthesis
MNPLSVVIITRNEEHNIADCIRSAQLISNDIIVVDSGSKDQTVSIALTLGASIIRTGWKGYGASRNLGAGKAKHNWILALDADERITENLAESIRQTRFDDKNCIYRFKRKNYLGKKKISFGTLGFETVKRIYNRNYAEWDLTPVHEKLIAPGATRKIIKGHIEHYGLKNAADYKAKAVLYAQMSAEKYFLQGRSAGLLKRIFSPFFNSVKSYVFQLGFLDGSQGWVSARTIAYYSWLKYFYLHQLIHESRFRQIDLVPKPNVERA